MHLIQCPFPLMQRRDNGNEYIGVMLNGVQIKVVLIVVMGAFVGVEVALKLCFHRAILRFRAQHIGILRWIGAGRDPGADAIHQHRAGGQTVEQKRQHQQNRGGNGKAAPVLPHIFASFLSLFSGFFRGLGGILCRLCRSLRRLIVLGSGILLLNGLLLLPFGNGIAGGAVDLCFLLERVNVGSLQFFLRTDGGAIRLELMGAVGRLYQPPAALHGLLNLVRSLYAHIVILALRHLPVNLRENKVGRGIPHGMGQLGGRLFLVHFLKPELRFYLAGGRIKAAFLFDHGFLGNFGLRLIRLGRCFFHLLDGLFQLRLGKIGVGKL